MTTKLNILFISDFSLAGDISLRIKREVEALQRAGYVVGLIHVAYGSPSVVTPDIQSLFLRGLAVPLASATQVETDLVIVHSPSRARVALPNLSGIRAKRVLLVHDRPVRPHEIGVWHHFALGEMHWVPTNRWVRRSLEDLNMPVPIETEDWRSLAAPSSFRPHQHSATRPLFVGRISTDESDQWSDDPALLEASHQLPAGVTGIAVGAPRKGNVRHTLTALNWTFLERRRMSLDRLIGQLDALLYMPPALPRELPEAAISTALASGKLVVLPPFLRPHVGPGALYCEPQECAAILTALASDETTGTGEGTDDTCIKKKINGLREDAHAQAQKYFPTVSYLDNMRRLIASDVAPTKPSTPAVVQKRKPNALFVASNGIGLGHLTRLLAIARRIDTEVTPIFANLPRANTIVQSFGYQSEYIPSYGSIGASIKEWDTWFEYDVRGLMDRYDPAAVVFDGNNLTSGLVNAVTAHDHAALCWIRRGMYGTAKAPFIDNARYCDLIIEPGELAAERDYGVTAGRKHETLSIPPIVLLNQAELKSREEARAALRLDPDAPAVLVHLGAGANRNLPGLVDQVIRHLRTLPNVQIVLAEWASGAYAFPPFKNVKTLRGFPISQYFRAFDFSIASAGYNSFHEVIAFGLPTLFIANRDPSMDDQAGRAQFAQDHGAGLDLEESQLGLLPTILHALSSDPVQAALRQGCAGLATENGAVQAADAIKKLVSAGRNCA